MTKTSSIREHDNDSAHQSGLRCLLGVLIFAIGIAAHVPALATHTWTFSDGDLTVKWDLEKDRAVLSSRKDGAVKWQGSLLPAFWYLNAKQEKRFSKATVRAVSGSDQLQTLSLEWPGFGKGTLLVTKEKWGWKFQKLQIQQDNGDLRIVEMYIGASQKIGDQYVGSTWDRPFMPDWQAFGYCVPGAKGGTVQSYFRSWDFGHATLALGNFGPSMGTPYGAAFPRPVLFAGMGADGGWLTVGAGSVPDAAMSLKLQSARSCVQFSYREDLWGAKESGQRIWQDLLHFSLDTTARSSFEKYYASFSAISKRNDSLALRKQTVSIWNTWGMWRFRKYPIRPIADFMEKMQNEVLVLDDPWESSQGSGQPDLKRFPDFYADLAYIRNKKAGVGLWETVGWIKDTASCGLGAKDLILGKDGKPCKGNWNFDPEGEAYYCLDFSSERTRKFLWDRTVRIMKEIRPQLIKLDFGYGLPGPDMGAPRNPEFRGERHSFEVMQHIARAARSVDPHVVIMGYGISPLWTPVTDLISMDDQGDLWYDLNRGHQEWSIWASLLSAKGMAISGSSCYDWSLDKGILQNSVILGSPGAVLPLESEDKKEVPSEFLNRRLAVNIWHRRTTHWKPKWLNSHTGDMKSAPVLRNWGRVESFGNKEILSALVLRSDVNTKDNFCENISWRGDWALIAQDNDDLLRSGKLAVIPFSAGEVTIPLTVKPGRIVKKNIKGERLFENWKWANGRLILAVNEQEFADTAGFLIIKSDH